MEHVYGASFSLGGGGGGGGGGMRGATTLPSYDKSHDLSMCYLAREVMW